MRARPEKPHSANKVLSASEIPVYKIILHVSSVSCDYSIMYETSKYDVQKPTHFATGIFSFFVHKSRSRICVHSIHVYAAE